MVVYAIFPPEVAVAVTETAMVIVKIITAMTVETADMIAPKVVAMIAEILMDTIEMEAILSTKTNNANIEALTTTVEAVVEVLVFEEVEAVAEDQMADLSKRLPVVIFNECQNQS